MAGRSLPHAVLMMVPEAWENADGMDPAKHAFYEFSASLMEPWDGPACVTFTDGSLIGAVLDRNGLRPARWWETADGRIVLASEVGVLDIPADQVVRKGRLQPGKMFLVDTAQGRVVSDDEVKAELAAQHPYDEWLHAGLTRLADLPARRAPHLLARERAAPPADVRLHRGGGPHPRAPDGRHRAGADRLDGHRHPGRRALRAPAGALRLLQPAVRAGDEPAAGRHPRGARHQPVEHPRPGAEPARARRRQLPADRPAVPRAGQRRPGPDRARQRRRRPAGDRGRQGARPVPGQRRRRGAARRARPGPSGGVHRDRRRRPDHRAQRPRLHRAHGADPVAAAHRRGPPPPHPREDPHPGRADRRGGRRPRGAPRRAAHRLRRRRRSTPTWRSRPSRTSSSRASCPTWTSTPRCATTSRPSARGCSR